MRNAEYVDAGASGAEAGYSPREAQSVTAHKAQVIHAPRRWQLMGNDSHLHRTGGNGRHLASSCDK